MLWRDIGYLCKAVKKLDAMRRPTKTEYEKREIFCNEKGIKRNEFYQAQTAGYKPELCVEIKASEYHKEEYFGYGGDMYRILRSYPTKAENLEIICTALVNENV
jgi:SPP1 family predicted phage head-tail adaptor